MKGVLIGICGGSGSGKSTLSRALAERLGCSDSAVLQQDSYYKDLSSLPADERTRMNFDHPSAIDWDLLVGHLGMLRQGIEIEVPCYDFSIHSRLTNIRKLASDEIIIIEGHLLLSQIAIREMLDLKIFLDASPDLMLQRRIKRDVAERARSIESVAHQYSQSVKPMYLEFVYPSRKWADVVINADSGPEKILEQAIKGAESFFGHYELKRANALRDHNSKW